MGLLGRIGKNFADSFPQQMSRHRGDPWSVGDLAGYSAVNTGLGAGAGAIFGDAPGADMGQSIMTGAAIGGLGTAAPVLLKKAIMAIAQSLKKQHPDVPDEMILKKAQELAEQQQGMNRTMGYDTAADTGGRFP